MIVRRSVRPSELIKRLDRPQTFVKHDIQKSAQQTLLLGVYLDRISLAAISHVTWCLNFGLMHRVVITCPEVSKGVLPTFLGWLNKLKWMLNWCSGRKFLQSYVWKAVWGNLLKQLLQNIGANITTRRQTQQRNLTWTTATVTTWPLAALYMCFCACHKIGSTHTEYWTEKYFGQPIWSRTNSKFSDQHTTSVRLGVLRQPNKMDAVCPFQIWHIQNINNNLRNTH